MGSVKKKRSGAKLIQARRDHHSQENQKESTSIMVLYFFLIKNYLEKIFFGRREENF